MSYPFRRILIPLDFDDDSMAAVDAAALIARDSRARILLAHAVPLIVPPPGRPIPMDTYKAQEDVATAKLRDIADRRLQGIDCVPLVTMGAPARSIVELSKRNAADLIVIATHGRRGFSRLLFGSVAETVLREAPCPVLCVRSGEADKNLVGAWMSTALVTSAPNDKLSVIRARMQEGNFRSIPVVDGGRLVGLVTDRDVRMNATHIDTIEAKFAMSEKPMTVTPDTPLHEATRMIFDHKLDSLPVLENEKLVGILTNSDILRASLKQN